MPFFQCVMPSRIIPKSSPARHRARHARSHRAARSESSLSWQTSSRTSRVNWWSGFRRWRTFEIRHSHNNQAPHEPACQIYPCNASIALRFDARSCCRRSTTGSPPSRGRRNSRGDEEIAQQLSHRRRHRRMRRVLDGKPDALGLLGARRSACNIAQQGNDRQLEMRKPMLDRGQAMFPGKRTTELTPAILLHGFAPEFRKRPQTSPKPRTRPAFEQDLPAMP